MRSLSIGEVARRTGVRASAFRYYEAAGILPRPVRKKLLELDVLAARVRQMRHALLKASKCGCIRIEDCSLSPDLETSSDGHGAKTSRNCSC